MSGGSEGSDLAAAFDEHLAELPDPGGLPVTGAEQATSS